LKAESDLDHTKEELLEYMLSLNCSLGKKFEQLQAENAKLQAEYNECNKSWKMMHEETRGIVAKLQAELAGLKKKYNEKGEK
jgi:hypothetical protein